MTMRMNGKTGFIAQDAMDFRHTMCFTVPVSVCVKSNLYKHAEDILLSVYRNVNKWPASLKMFHLRVDGC